MVAGTKATRQISQKAVGDRSTPQSVRQAANVPGQSPWRQDFFTALWPSLLSGLILWLAFPPVNWRPLAWIAPVGWLVIVMRAKAPGRGGYWGIWVAASL